MKITLAQQNFIVSDIDGNAQKIKNTIKQHPDSDIIVFPELALTGYPPSDFFLRDDFLRKVEQITQEIAKLCVNQVCILSVPTLQSGRGKPFYNSALVLRDGKVERTIHKHLLPEYDVFNERRFFESGHLDDCACISFQGKKIALTICEDIWETINEKEYASSPLQRLSREEPDMIINISASPFSIGHIEKRQHLAKTIVEKYKKPFIYVNQVGAQTDLIFDGSSFVMDAQGIIVEQMPSFEEADLTIDTEKRSSVPKSIKKQEIEQIHDALILGIKDYFAKLGLKKAVLGLSGGIDSAVVCCLAVKALGKDCVEPLLLPSQYTSAQSIEEAVLLAKNLGVRLQTVSIDSVFSEVLTKAKPLFSNQNFGLTEENMQSRIRAVLLMAFSNNNGHVLLNTSNKSEIAVGYGTLYGDLCGAISVIGDLYKTQVYELARFLNAETELIPEGIITRPPSAELRPDQKDCDSLPDYDTLDGILKLYIEENCGVDTIHQKGYDKQTIADVISLVQKAEFKRFQTPPILRISNKSFGRGRKFEIVSKPH